MKYLLTLIFFCINAFGMEFKDYENRAEAWTNTDLLGYDPITNPNRTGVISVSLDLNTIRVYLADPSENPVLPHQVLLHESNHYCWQYPDGTWRYRSYQYVGPNYMVDVVLNHDNSLWVYLDGVLFPQYENWCVEIMP